VTTLVEGEFTRLLIEWRQGDQAALDALLPKVYEQLRHIAARQMSRERPDHTLQATALVHEAWMQLAGAAKIDWQDRAHFVAVAARVMRQILVHYARTRNAEKRGSGAVRLELNEAIDSRVASRECDLLGLDDALDKLAANDERKARIIEMAYFGGLTHEEMATVLGVSVRTVRRDLQVAHAFLHWQMSGESNALGAAPQ
jgi:RNA polymerase sigma-70 factor, ECF subfamily